jgi:enoyl-CoA hydratase/carnithine racemase
VYRVLSAGLGERRVLELALTGRVFGAAEAKEIGLVQEIASSPLARAAEIAGAVSEFSPTTIRSGLRFTREVRGCDWESAGRIARARRDEVFAGTDFQEGLRAFVEKRTPKWPSIHGHY